MTQHERILNLLRSYNGEWCPLPKILDLHISQYWARILELRRRGYVIENKEIEVVNGEKHTAFRLISEPKQELPEPVYYERKKQLVFI